MGTAATAITAGVALLGFAWSVFVYTRDNGTRKPAERAERAGNLVQLLNTIDLGGADVGLDVTAVRARHEEQLRDLHKVIRLSSAEFVTRALRPALSSATVLFISTYSVAFFFFGISIFEGAKPGADAATRVGTASAALVFIILGILGAVSAAVAVVRRAAFVERQRRAGIHALTTLQTFKADLAEMKTLLIRFRKKRRNQKIPSNQFGFDSTPTGQCIELRGFVPD